jgi:hypothetical protein
MSGRGISASWDVTWTHHDHLTMALLNPHLIIIQDLGVNDFVVTIGNTSASVFKANLIALIVSIRAAGMTCPIVLSMVYPMTYAGFSYVEAWANYVAAAQFKRPDARQCERRGVRVDGRHSHRCHFATMKGM